MNLIVQCIMGNEHTFVDVSAYLKPSGLCDWSAQVGHKVDEGVLIANIAFRR